MKTPGSSYSSAPRTRNSRESSVLPQPAPPHTSGGRPRGSPPLVISSSPGMPVGALASGRLGGCRPFPARFGGAALRRRTGGVVNGLSEGVREQGRECSPLGGGGRALRWGGGEAPCRPLESFLGL